MRTNVVYRYIDVTMIYKMITYFIITSEYIL